MKFFFKLITISFIALLLSCGSTKNNSNNPNNLLDSNYTISLSKSELIVNDTVKLIIDPQLKDERYNLEIQFIRTNLEFVKIINSNINLNIKSNNALVKNNLNGPVSFEFSTDIASNFRVKASITTDTQYFDKEFDLNVSNSDGTSSKDVSKSYNVLADIYNDTSIDISSETIAPFFAEQNESFYSVYDVDGYYNFVIKAKKNSFVRTNTVNAARYIRYTNPKIQTKLDRVYSNNILTLDSNEVHHSTDIIRLRVKEHVIKFVNNSDQTIKSIKVSNSKDDV